MTVCGAGMHFIFILVNLQLAFVGLVLLGVAGLLFKPGWLDVNWLSYLAWLLSAGRPSQDTLALLNALIVALNHLCVWLLICLAVTVFVFALLPLVAAKCRKRFLLTVYTRIAFVFACLVGLVTLTCLVAIRLCGWLLAAGLNVLVSFVYQLQNSPTGEYGKGFVYLINRLQQDRRCCGVYGYRDFQLTPGFNNQKNVVPQSCCRVLTDQVCWVGPTLNNSYIATPCIEVIDNVLAENYWAIVCTLLLTWFLLMLLIVLAKITSRVK